MKFDQYWVVAKGEQVFITSEPEEAIARFNELWARRKSPDEVVGLLGETPRGVLLDCCVFNGKLERITEEVQL